MKRAHSHGCAGKWRQLPNSQALDQPAAFQAEGLATSLTELSPVSWEQAGVRQAVKIREGGGKPSSPEQNGRAAHFRAEQPLDPAAPAQPSRLGDSPPRLLAKVSSSQSFFHLQAAPAGQWLERRAKGSKSPGREGGREGGRRKSPPSLEVPNSRAALLAHLGPPAFSSPPLSHTAPTPPPQQPPASPSAAFDPFLTLSASSVSSEWPRIVPACHLVTLSACQENAGWAAI